MNSAVKHRARGQALTLVGILMLALIGTVAVVADWGVFYVLQRELQSAADAGALAAAWYVPVCSSSWVDDGCQPGNGMPTSGFCATKAPPPAGDQVACQVARQFVGANLSSLVGMCDGFDLQAQSSVDSYPSVPTTANLQMYIVIIHCSARHIMGNLLPGVPPTYPLGARAAAIIGYRGPSGDVSSTPSSTLITRLVVIPTS